MTGLAMLIPIALSMGLLALVVFFWAMRSGQFDDLDGAALRVLIDEEDAAKDAGDTPETAGKNTDQTASEAQP